MLAAQSIFLSINKNLLVQGRSVWCSACAVCLSWFPSGAFLCFDRLGTV